MERLELKHLAPYLPYWLKGKVNAFYGDGITKNIDCDVRWLSSSLILSVQCYDINGVEWPELHNSNIDDFRPLLIPLSSFWNFHDKQLGTIHSIIYNETKLSLDQDLDIEIEANMSDIYISLLKANHALNILFQYHFDFFGLIEKGLALNKLDYVNG